MPLEIRGTTYFSTSRVLEDADVSRQTLWRWRREGLVPRGHRFRNGQLLFTQDEYQEILAYANHVEPEQISRAHAAESAGARR